jgi:type II secretory pathway pseudopilin PulG
MNKKLKNRQEKGITLIALVVTIVVLLILAGVSISLVLNNNGVISKAKDAKNQYAEAQTNEEKQLNEVSDWIDTKVGDTTGGGSTGGSGDSTTKVDGVPIPEGYYYVGGTKAKGMVISDNVADKELDKGKENVRRDLAGNQWVWVPVETPSSLYTTIDAGVALSGSTGVKTTKYTNTIISGQTRGLPGSTNYREYREPDIVTTYDNDTNAKTAGFSSLTNMAENMKSDYEEMIASLEKYKGFYIGRYELTANGEKTGATQTDDWYTLYKNCTTLASGTKVKTRMIWGLQWDATCNWLAGSGFDITDSTSWGNYKDNTATGHGSKQNTGYSESWKANNIYDFAGNCDELTQEAYGTNGRATGGGYYFSSGSDCPASFRSCNAPFSPYGFSSSRPTLYLIP